MQRELKDARDRYCACSFREHSDTYILLFGRTRLFSDCFLQNNEWLKAINAFCRIQSLTETQRTLESNRADLDRFVLFP